MTFYTYCIYYLNDLLVVTYIEEAFTAFLCIPVKLDEVEYINRLNKSKLE